MYIINSITLYNNNSDNGRKISASIEQYMTTYSQEQSLSNEEFANVKIQLLGAEKLF